MSDTAVRGSRARLNNAKEANSGSLQCCVGDEDIGELAASFRPPSASRHPSSPQKLRHTIASSRSALASDGLSLSSPTNQSVLHSVGPPEVESCGRCWGFLRQCQQSIAKQHEAAAAAVFAARQRYQAKKARLKDLITHARHEARSGYTSADENARLLADVRLQLVDTLAELDYTRAQWNRTQSDLQSLKLEASSLQAQLDASRAAELLAETTTQAAGRARQHAQASSEAQLVQITTLEETVTRVRQDNRQLAQTVASLHLALDTLKAELESVRQQQCEAVAALTTATEQHQTTKNVLHDTAAELQGVLDRQGTIKHQHFRLTEQLRQGRELASMEATEWQQRWTQLRLEYVQLQSQFTVQASEVRKLRMAVQTLRQTTGDLNRTVEQQCSDISTLRAQLEASSQYVKDLQRQAKGIVSGSVLTPLKQAKKLRPVPPSSESMEHSLG